MSSGTGSSGPGVDRSRFTRATTASRFERRNPAVCASTSGGEVMRKKLERTDLAPSEWDAIAALIFSERVEAETTPLVTVEEIGRAWVRYQDNRRAVLLYSDDDPAAT